MRYGENSSKSFLGLVNDDDADAYDADDADDHNDDVNHFWPDHWCSSLTSVSVHSDYLKVLRDPYAVLGIELEYVASKART